MQINHRIPIDGIFFCKNGNSKIKWDNLPKNQAVEVPHHTSNWYNTQRV